MQAGHRLTSDTVQPDRPEPNVLKNSPMYKPPATVKVAMLPGTDLNTGLHHRAMVQITETVARDLAPSLQKTQRQLATDWRRIWCSVSSAVGC